MACGTISLKRSFEFDPLHTTSPHCSTTTTRPVKRRRCGPYDLSTSLKAKPVKRKSNFSEGPSISSEEIAAHLNLELKRLHHRRKLCLPRSPSSLMGDASSLHACVSDEALSTSPASSPLSALGSRSASPSNKDVPLFTMKQVSLVCERLLKECEEKIRDEYDQALTQKLSEQYEAFLKFNHDQLHRRLDETPASYVS